MSEELLFSEGMPKSFTNKQLEQCIGDKDRELARLRAELEKATLEAKALLDIIPKETVVHVHEGLGPENIWASLAISVSKMEEQLDAARKERDELKDMAAYILISSDRGSPYEVWLKRYIRKRLSALDAAKEATDKELRDYSLRTAGKGWVENIDYGKSEDAAKKTEG